MNKQEFIEGLRRSLSSINDYTFVNDTISYYENYIDTQIRMGKTEAEVMEQLGDPRLIAKSIRATHVEGTHEEEDRYQEYGQASYDDGGQGDKSVLRFINHVIRMPSWLAKMIGILLVALVLFVVFTVLRWLTPFILMGCGAYLVYKLFFGKY